MSFSSSSTASTRVTSVLEKSQISTPPTFISTSLPSLPSSPEPTNLNPPSSNSLSTEAMEPEKEPDASSLESNSTANGASSTSVGLSSISEDSQRLTSNLPKSNGNNSADTAEIKTHLMDNNKQSPLLSSSTTKIIENDLDEETTTNKNYQKTEFLDTPESSSNLEDKKNMNGSDNENNNDKNTNRTENNDSVNVEVGSHTSTDAHGNIKADADADGDADAVAVAVAATTADDDNDADTTITAPPTNGSDTTPSLTASNSDKVNQTTPLGTNLTSTTIISEETEALIAINSTSETKTLMTSLVSAKETRETAVEKTIKPTPKTIATTETTTTTSSSSSSSSSETHPAISIANDEHHNIPLENTELHAEQFPALPPNDHPVVNHDDILPQKSLDYPSKPPSTSSLSSLSSSDPENDNDTFLSKDIPNPLLPNDLDTSMHDSNSELSDPIDSEAETERLGGAELPMLDHVEIRHRPSSIHPSLSIPQENNYNNVSQNNSSMSNGTGSNSKIDLLSLSPSKRRRNSSSPEPIKKIRIDNTDSQDGETKSNINTSDKSKTPLPTTITTTNHENGDPKNINANTPISISTNTNTSAFSSPSSSLSSSTTTNSTTANTSTTITPISTTTTITTTSSDNTVTKQTTHSTNSTKIIQDESIADKKFNISLTDDLSSIDTADTCSEKSPEKSVKSAIDENKNATLSDVTISRSLETREKQSAEESGNDQSTGDTTVGANDNITSDAETSDAKNSMTDEEILAAQQAERKEALSQLTDIEIEFAKLRDQIHADKMARYLAEIEMCAEGTHPDLENVCNDIQNVRDERIKRAEQRRKYQRICIDIQTRASREQHHQQFLKDRADIRAKLLLNTTEEWYRVNRERRLMDSMVPEYGFRPPLQPAIQVQQQQAYRAEVSILSNISHTQGFPAAPEMKPGTEEEIEEDFRAFGMSQYYKGNNNNNNNNNAPPQANGHHYQRHHHTHYHLPHHHHHHHHRHEY